MEITKKLPRRLSISIDQKWSTCLVHERKIREAKLALLFTKLKLEAVKKNIWSYKKKFNPKSMAFQILKSQSEELALQTKKKWKEIFEMTTPSPTNPKDKSKNTTDE